MKNMDKLKDMKPTKAQEDEADRIEDRMDTCKSKLESSSHSRSRSRPSVENTGSPECDEYLETFDLLVDTCSDKLGPALDALKQSRDAQADAFREWATLDDVSRKATIEAAATGCKSATDALRQSATAMGCRL